MDSAECAFTLRVLGKSEFLDGGKMILKGFIPQLERGVPDLESPRNDSYTTIPVLQLGANYLDDPAWNESDLEEQEQPV